MKNKYHASKGSGSNLVTYLTWTPIFEWCMVRCGSKDKHEKNMSLKEIELIVQNFLTILHSSYDFLPNTFENSYQCQAGSKFLYNWSWLLHLQLWIGQNLAFTNWSCIWRKSGKSNCLRPIHLTRNAPHDTTHKVKEHRTCKLESYIKSHTHELTKAMMLEFQL